MTEKKLEEGWGAPGCSRKFHYFTKGGRSLCGKIGFYFGVLDPDEGKETRLPDDCAECFRRLQRDKARR